MLLETTSRVPATVPLDLLDSALVLIELVRNHITGIRRVKWTGARSVSVRLAIPSISYLSSSFEFGPVLGKLTAS